MILSQKEQGNFSILDISLFFWLISLDAAILLNELFSTLLCFDLWAYLLNVFWTNRLGFKGDYLI